MAGMTQPSLFDAQERGRTGMLRAVEHAERVEPGWTETALEALRAAVRNREDSFTIEQVRLAIACSVPVPTDERSWGAVTQTAIKRGVIAKAVGQFAPAASSNGSWKQLYRRGSAA